MRNYRYLTVLLLLLLFLVPASADAYIGPGAGFALVTSFFVIFVSMLIAASAIMLLPLKAVYKLFKRKKTVGRMASRVVVVGLDGLSPKIVNEMTERGELPNLAKLSAQGTFTKLQTTNPPISPVAWSSFQCGVNPGKHNIFDFLKRNKKGYYPELSSVRIEDPPRMLKIGKYVIPLSKPFISPLRKSIPFWKIVGDYDIMSCVLRVPITFPPEKFKGMMLSAMCVPDLKGTQGSFTFYSSKIDTESESVGGLRIPVEVDNGRVKTYIGGPNNPFLQTPTELKIPITIDILEDRNAGRLHLDGSKIMLKVGEYSDWTELKFKAVTGVKIQGICRFLLKKITPHFELYITPINIDPDKPSVPISEPFTYAIYLSKVLGRYSTLGLAEDTWALNENVISDKDFLEQAYLIQEERERKFFDAMEKTKKGLCVCVFDITDRVQHMFWSYFDENHPAHKANERNLPSNPILDVYKKMDDLVGRTMAKLGKNDVLIVLSDHSFTSFSRCMNLNSWLCEKGYLVLKEGKEESEDYLRDVDWSKSRAFSIGLSCLYLNIKGREAQGIVEPGDEERELKKELIAKLTGLKDPENGKVAITNAYDRDKIYTGPYTKEAPDIIVGYNREYRASWETVTGKFGKTVFEDNTKNWSGDHCIDTALMPGCFFCNREIDTDTPSMIDIAPSILDLFGIKAPGHMDGVSMFGKSRD